MTYIIIFLLGILIGVIFSKQKVKSDGILRLFGYDDPEGPYMRLELNKADFDQVIVKDCISLDVVRDNPDSQE